MLKRLLMNLLLWPRQQQGALSSLKNLERALMTNLALVLMKQVDQLADVEFDEPVRIGAQVEQVIEQLAFVWMLAQGFFIAVIKQEIGKDEIESRQQLIPQAELLTAIIVERASELFDLNRVWRSQMRRVIQPTGKQVANGGSVNEIGLMKTQRILLTILIDGSRID